MRNYTTVNLIKLIMLFYSYRKIHSGCTFGNAASLPYKIEIISVNAKIVAWIMKVDVLAICMYQKSTKK